MNEMFNQSILHVDGGVVGRHSISSNQTLEFSSTQASEADTSREGGPESSGKIVDDMRGSSLRGKRKNMHDVQLQDFEIQLQLGRGTFGRVYLAILPATGKKYAIKAIRKDVLIEYD